MLFGVLPCALCPGYWSCVLCLGSVAVGGGDGGGGSGGGGGRGSDGGIGGGGSGGALAV